MVGCALALPAAAAELRADLPGRDLVLELPEGWRGQVRRPRPDAPPTMGITADPKAFQILITAIPPVGGMQAPGAEEIRDIVARGAASAKPRAVEPELEVKELRARGKAGYYFFATDREPEPDGFKYLTQGAIGFDELRITFTILANGEPQKVIDPALEMLRSMRRGPPRQ